MVRHLKGRRGATALVALAALALMLAFAGTAAAASLLTIPAEESGNSGTVTVPGGPDEKANDWHIISLGATSHVPWEGVTDQWRIDQMVAQGSRPMIAHPNEDDFPYEYLVTLDHVFGMEVYHSTSEYSMKWDQLLTAGKKWWGFGVDDSHNQPLTGGTCFIQVRAASATTSSILAAIDAGSFYASQGPLFSDLGVTSGGRVYARTPVASTIRFISRGSVVFQRANVTYADWDPRNARGYVRVEIARASDGRLATSQPFYVSSRGNLSNPYTISGSWFKGAVHFHTQGSDGKYSPADAMDWYAGQGYSFLAPGDHNVITTDFVRPTVDGVAVSLGAFSPNADGYEDTVTFSYTTHEPTTNRVYVYDSAGNVLRYLTGWIPSPAGTFNPAWDGKYTDASGAYVYAPDGTYAITAKVKDAVGNLSEASLPVVVDRTITKLTASALFSPNGDGAKDISTITYALQRAATVTTVVKEGSGTVLRTLETAKPRGAGSWTVTWNGRDEAGTVMPEGSYTVVVTAVSGTGTISATAATAIDLTAPMVSNFSVTPSFTPPGRAAIAFTTTEPGTATVYILDVAGTNVKTLTSTIAAGPKTLYWDGSTSAGTPAPPGSYRVKLYVKDLASNKATVYPLIAPVVVQGTTVKLTLTVSAVFSPNDDGAKDISSITYTLDRAATVTTVVKDGSDHVVRTLETATSREAGSWTLLWDGRDNVGTVMPEGSYTVVVTAVSGTGTISATAATAIDLTAPMVSNFSVTPSFTPPGQAAIAFTTTEPGTATVYILDVAGTNVKTLTSTIAAGPKTLYWDGSTSAGTPAPPGSYQVKLYVKDLASNKATVYPLIAPVVVSP